MFACYLMVSLLGHCFRDLHLSAWTRRLWNVSFTISYFLGTTRKWYLSQKDILVIVSLYMTMQWVFCTLLRCPVSNDKLLYNTWWIYPVKEIITSLCCYTKCWMNPGQWNNKENVMLLQWRGKNWNNGIQAVLLRDFRGTCLCGISVSFLRMWKTSSYHWGVAVDR